VILQWQATCNFLLVTSCWYQVALNLPACFHRKKIVSTREKLTHAVEHQKKQLLIARRETFYVAAAISIFMAKSAQRFCTIEFHILA